MGHHAVGRGPKHANLSQAMDRLEKVQSSVHVSTEAELRTTQGGRTDVMAGCCWQAARCRQGTPSSDTRETRRDRAVMERRASTTICVRVMHHQVYNVLNYGLHYHATVR